MAQIHSAPISAGPGRHLSVVLLFGARVICVEEERRPVREGRVTTRSSRWSPTEVPTIRSSLCSSRIARRDTVILTGGGRFNGRSRIEAWQAEKPLWGTKAYPHRLESFQARKHRTRGARKRAEGKGMAMWRLFVIERRLCWLR
jgi:hypothetical protein